MSKEFELGQRVAVYEDGERVICRIQEIYFTEPNRVKVNAGNDHSWKYRVVHKNQIRRLKPKPKAEKNKAREWYLRFNKENFCDGVAPYFLNKRHANDEVVKVREVLHGTVTIDRETLAKAWDETFHTQHQAATYFSNLCKALGLEAKEGK